MPLTKLIFSPIVGFTRFETETMLSLVVYVSLLSSVSNLIEASGVAFNDSSTIKNSPVNCGKDGSNLPISTLLNSTSIFLH